MPRFPAFMRSPRSLGAGVALSALLAGAVAAEEAKGPNIDPTGTGKGGAVATLALAHELFVLGEAHGDALTVLAAARLAASVETAPGKELRRSTSGEGEAQEAGAPPQDPALQGPADAAAMFDLALSLAGEDTFLADLVLDARDATGRGRIGGAFSQRASLTPGRTDSWEIPFAGGAYAELSVIGTGASDLDIVVTDENGNVICFEGGQEDALYCDFMPSWDGFFVVAVENKGTGAAAYDLVTN